MCLFDKGPLIFFFSSLLVNLTQRAAATEILGSHHPPQTSIPSWRRPNRKAFQKVGTYLEARTHAHAHTRCRAHFCAEISGAFPSFTYPLFPSPFILGYTHTHTDYKRHWIKLKLCRFLLIIQILHVLAFFSLSLPLSLFLPLFAVHRGDAAKRGGGRDKAELNDCRRSFLITAVWVCSSW